MDSKIVINARFLTQPITGTQRFAIELCKELKKMRPDILLVAPDNILHSEIAQELGVEIVGKLRKGILWEQLELPIILKKLGNPLLLNLCNLAPINYTNNIVSVLDLSYHIHPEWFSKSFSLLYNFFIPIAVKKAKGIITISNNSKKDLITYYKVPDAKINIIYPSVSDIFFNKNFDVKSQNHNQYGKYILAVSSIDPRKNFISLIRAFKESNLPDIKLVIVGSEHKVFADNNIKLEVGIDKRIIFTGYVDDKRLIDLYKNAHLFAYPSYFEGFGIPPLEAMACGCPTLVSNTTSMPEACGNASVYVDPYDVTSIKNGLIKLALDEKLRQDLINEGLKQIKSFSWKSSAEKLLYIIDDLP